MIDEDLREMRTDRIAHRIVRHMAMPTLGWGFLFRYRYPKLGLSFMGVLVVLFLIFPPGVNSADQPSSEPTMRGSEAIPANNGDDSTIHPTNDVYDVLQNSPVFENPNVSSNVVAHIRRGKAIHVIGTSDKFLEIKRRSGVVGFVPRSVAKYRKEYEH